MELKKRLTVLVIVLSLLLLVACRESIVPVTEPPTEAVAQPLESTSGAIVTGENLLNPASLVYVGAFRLPDEGERPLTFAYGGAAMTYNPHGDAQGSHNGFPGSLFVMGHNRMPYNELPDGNQVAEINIPVPKVSALPEDLNQAEFLQPFSDVAVGYFTNLDEIPRAGMQYLSTAATGPLIHLAWGQHMQDGEAADAASHAWFSPDLSQPAPQGPWYIGNQSVYSVNDYLFEIPAAWAEQYTGGRMLATGRFRDGGWSGMGPSLFAYRPWVAPTGEPEPPQTRLSEVVLLQYSSSRHTDRIEKCLEGYQHADEWSGGAWVTTADGRSAVIFVGTKATGDRYWYGYLNPAQPEQPCIEEGLLGQFELCRYADGTPHPQESSLICTAHSSERGWWSSSFSARFILYDPAVLAQVAEGQLEPWEPQPYAWVDIDQNLFRNPDGVEQNMLGTGAQRRHRVGDMAYDRVNGLLYVLELFADGDKPVAHVWSLQ